MVRRFTLVRRLLQVEQLTSPLADGWGICTDGRSLIVSDSSATLTWLDPATMVKQRTVEVHDSDRPVAWINEVCVAPCQGLPIPALASLVVF